MAVTVTQIYADEASMVVDIIADNDADVAATIAHAMEETPIFVWVTNLLDTSLDSNWRVTGITAGQVTLAKDNAVGTGNPAPQIRVGMFTRYQCRYIRR
jgi:hypothetical protein